jgi:hypothetical protein
MNKDKMALETLKDHLRYFYSRLTSETDIINETIESIEKQKRKKSESQINFLETLDYLCVKYSVHNKIS